MMTLVPIPPKVMSQIGIDLMRLKPHKGNEVYNFCSGLLYKVLQTRCIAKQRRKYSWQHGYMTTSSAGNYINISN